MTEAAESGGGRPGRAKHRQKTTSEEEKKKTSRHTGAYRSVEKRTRLTNKSTATTEQLFQTGGKGVSRSLPGDDQIKYAGRQTGHA